MHRAGGGWPFRTAVRVGIVPMGSLFSTACAKVPSDDVRGCGPVPAAGAAGAPGSRRRRAASPAARARAADRHPDGSTVRPACQCRRRATGGADRRVARRRRRGVRAAGGRGLPGRGTTGRVDARRTPTGRGPQGTRPTGAAVAGSTSDPGGRTSASFRAMHGCARPPRAPTWRRATRLGYLDGRGRPSCEALCRLPEPGPRREADTPIRCDQRGLRQGLPCSQRSFVTGRAPGGRGSVDAMSRRSKRANGLEVIGVPVDDDGVLLRRAGGPAPMRSSSRRAPVPLGGGPRPRPAELRPGRRPRTTRLIIEDDYDAEFRYDREPIGCMQGLAWTRQLRRIGQQDARPRPAPGLDACCRR